MATATYRFIVPGRYIGQAVTVFDQVTNAQVASGAVGSDGAYSVALPQGDYYATTPDGRYIDADTSGVPNSDGASAARAGLADAFVAHLGPSNGTDDQPALQAALTAARTAGRGRIIGKPGETYIVAAESIIGSNTVLELSGLTVKNGTNVHALRNYSEKNPVATGTDGAVTSGSNVVTTNLGAQAVVGQTLIIAGAGGNGNGPLVGKVSARTATTITLKTLDGRNCNATATVSAAAVTLCNRDTNISVKIGTLANGNNTAAAPGYGVLFFRHVDNLRVELDNYTSGPGAASRGIGWGSATGFFIRVNNANSGSVVAQGSGPLANGRVDYVRGTAADDLLAFTAGDYSTQQSTAGDIVNVTVGSVIAENTGLNVYKIIAGAGWLCDGIKVDGTISGTGLSAGCFVGDDSSQTPTIGGTYGEIDLGYVNLQTSSYPIALVAPNAKRIKATVRHVPSNGGLTQEAIGLGGSSANVIDTLELAGSVIGSTRGLIAYNNTSAVVNRLLVGDGIAGYRQNPLPSVASILAARVPIAPFVTGESWATTTTGRTATALGNVESGGAWTVWAGVPGVVNRYAGPTTAANTKAVASAVADGFIEMQLHAIPAGGEGWLVFRGVDTNNYWRFGYVTGSPSTLTLQKVVAGAGSTVGSVFNVPFATDVRLGVLLNGNAMTLFRNGIQVGTANDSFQATATLVGFQASATAAQFGPIFARSLVDNI